MFIDEARIRIKAGDGGNGAMAFRREKFVPRGGPSGGDGGHGGDILMQSSLSHNTLVHFRFNPEHKSERGGHGLGSNMSGATGDPLVLKVPVGTLLYDDDTGDLVHDFAQPNDQIVIARGGRGGRGNQHFATSTHQAPREHELGRPGEARNYRLELRLLADAGLVGFPNVGKSTLISRLSAARPKIANYEFTTLEPNLGVVQIGDAPFERSFTVADIPGLIEGAHLGAGLGVQFLKHIERTSLVIHLVDVSDASGRPDPVADYKAIAAELESFGHGIENKPVIIVATKIEIANPEKLKKLKAMAQRMKKKFFALSAVTGEGIEEFKFEVGRQIHKLRPAAEPEKPPAPKIKKVAPPASGKLARPKPVKGSGKISAKAAIKNQRKQVLNDQRK
jgi:GTP-binding protein